MPSTSPTNWSSRPAARNTVRTSGATGVPTGTKNLAGAAAKLLSDHTGLGTPVTIEIVKQIPVAGGMAGGSADAAAALIGCSALWGVDIGRDELAALGARLGSDVPFALSGGTAVGTGRGELLSPVLTRMTLHWVLGVVQDRAVDARGVRRTRSVARRRRPPAGRTGCSRCWPLSRPVIWPRWPRPWPTTCRPPRSRCSPSCAAHCGPVPDAGALAGIVSGSGPTLAFLCTDADHAAEVAVRLAGTGTCAGVKVAGGPAPGARLIASV